MLSSCRTRAATGRGIPIARLIREAVLRDVAGAGCEGCPITPREAAGAWLKEQEAAIVLKRHRPASPDETQRAEASLARDAALGVDHDRLPVGDIGLRGVLLLLQVAIDGASGPIIQIVIRSRLT